MKSSKIIIPGSPVVNIPTSLIVHKVIAAVKAQYGSDFPCSLNQLESLIETKKHALEQNGCFFSTEMNINFQDFICNILFNIQGIQAFKDIWKNAFSESLSKLEKAIETLPETLYLSHCDENESLYVLEDLSVDLSLNKRKFNSANELIFDELDSSAIWRKLTSIECDLIRSAYVASQIAIDTGVAGGGIASGFGNMSQDTAYIERLHGLNFVGVNQAYYSVTSEEEAIVIIEAKRIESLSELEAAFTKALDEALTLK